MNFFQLAWVGCVVRRWVRKKEEVVVITSNCPAVIYSYLLLFSSRVVMSWCVELTQYRAVYCFIIVCI